MKIISLLIVLLSLTPSITFGFSAGAHRIIADIAWQQMDRESRLEAYRVLKQHPRLKEDFATNMPDSVRSSNEATKARWLFHQAAVWPDTVRGLPDDEKRKYDRGTWHYVNFPTYLHPEHEERIDLSRVNLSTEWTEGDYDTKERLNVIQAIKLNVAGYQDEKRSDAQRAVHLCWLLDLIGDAHQPLHSTAMFTPSLFPKGCRGGNSIVVGRGNPHSTWDRLLPNVKTVGEVGSNAVKLMKREAKIGARAAKVSDPRMWIEESHALAKTYAYDRGVRAAIRAADESGDDEVTVELSVEYRKAAGRVAQRRVVEAGWRIAMAMMGCE